MKPELFWQHPDILFYLRSCYWVPTSLEYEHLAILRSGCVCILLLFLWRNKIRDLNISYRRHPNRYTYMRDIYKIPPNCLINTACALHVLVRHSWGENGVLFFFFPPPCGKIKPRHIFVASRGRAADSASEIILRDQHVWNVRNRMLMTGSVSKGAVFDSVCCFSLGRCYFMESCANCWIRSTILERWFNLSTES